LRVAADGDGLAVIVPLRKGAPPAPPLAAFSVGDDGTRPNIKDEEVMDGPLVKRPGADGSARFWKCKAMPVGGRSGGPLLDSGGALIGICSGGDGANGYYTHLDEIRRFLKSNGLGFLAR
jgi:hypothetical protein